MRALLVNASAPRTLGHTRRIQKHACHHHRHPKQHFLTASAPRTFTITRKLPYNVQPVYEIIADVSSYSEFIPYCSSSAVTARSGDDAHGRTWPTEARLAVSWRGLTEEWSSRLHCEPERVVEAVANVPRGAIQSGFGASSAIKSLRARWTVKAVEKEEEEEAGGGGKSGETVSGGCISSDSGTLIKFEIEYAFANAIYEAMGAAFAPKVAGMVVEAFEKRAKFLLGR